MPQTYEPNYDLLREGSQTELTRLVGAWGTATGHCQGLEIGMENLKQDATFWHDHAMELREQLEKAQHSIAILGARDAIRPSL
jgi:hypothetical protein